MDSSRKHHNHDTHAMPPQAICNIYKKYQKADDESVDHDIHVVDFSRGLTDAQKKKIIAVDSVPSELMAEAQRAFQTYGTVQNEEGPASGVLPEACTIYQHTDFPGLRIYPSLLPPESQVIMLNSILHRDLANPLHKTNIQADYHIPYPASSSSSSTGHPDSFFTYPPSSKHEVYTPLNPHSNQKSLNTTQFLGKKLRWLTLGEQYDWTTRSYPAESPTPFPRDIETLVKTLFRSEFKPQSGVVLLYGTKDYMPVHRDVSEQCQRGLASFTLGCDGLFIISREKDDTNKEDDNRDMLIEVLRVRSGDCIWMAGETRWCWHAMPKIMGGTCPDWLKNWPVVPDGAGRKEYEKWRGFMKGRRLNISCRQVWG